MSKLRIRVSRKFDNYRFGILRVGYPLKGLHFNIGRRFITIGFKNE